MVPLKKRLSAGALSLSSWGEHWEAQGGGDGPPHLRPCRGVDFDVARVEKGDRPRGDVETVGRLAYAQAPLVPEAAGDVDPLEAQGLDLGRAGFEACDQACVLADLAVRRVLTPAVGNQVAEPALAARADDLGLRVLGRRHREGDEEDVLPLQSRDDARPVVVIYVRRLHARGDYCGAVRSRVRAVTVCLPVLSSASTMYLPTLPPT